MVDRSFEITDNFVYLLNRITWLKIKQQKYKVSNVEMLKRVNLIWHLQANFNEAFRYYVMYWSSCLCNPIVFFRLTCAYLSCKVDEFNVSSTQFVANLVQESPAGQERVAEQILEYELLLIQQLNFHLVVHNPYRPMEGLLIDLKVGGPLQGVGGRFLPFHFVPFLFCFVFLHDLLSDQITYYGESRVAEEEC